MEIFVGQTPKNTTDKAFAYDLLQKSFAQQCPDHLFPPLLRAQKGKPYFSPDTVPSSQQYFNLSHSEGFVAVVFHHAPVGIDIQVPRKISPRLIERVCSPEEQAWLTAQGINRFPALWAMKEAYIKCRVETLGSGRVLATLSLPLPGSGLLPHPPYGFHLWEETSFALAVCGEEMGDPTLCPKINSTTQFAWCNP